MRLKVPKQLKAGSIIWMGLALVCGILSGCVQTNSTQQTEDLQKLLDAYHARSAQIESERQQQMYASIRHISVAKRSDGSGYVVSIDVDQAPVSLVVNQILTQTGAAYDMSDIQLGGTVTARFERLPLLEAINRLVNPHGVSVSQQKRILVFRRGVRATPATVAATGSDNGGSEDGTSDTADNVYEVVPLRNLKTADAATLLKGLYNFENSDNPAITVGELPDRNAIYVGGAPGDVANAVAVLAEADQDVPHVLIEALVVEYNITELEKLGIQLNDATVGEFTGVNLIPGATASNIVFTFLHGLTDPTQLTAVIDALVSIDKAQVLSRPFLAAQSNQQAKLSVVDERYVAIREGTNTTDISSQGLEAGVILDVTPTVLTGGLIRLDMSVEESEFEPQVAGALAQRGVSRTQTSMSIASGQTIVVGGLNRSRFSSGDAGLPKLRRAPLIGPLFSHKNAVKDTHEVVVYLTPYIWRPSLGLPIPDAHALGLPESAHGTVGASN